MTSPAPGAIDCDIHPALPSMQVLVPYLDEYWRAHVQMRGLDRDNYTASAFPPNAPINARPDWKPAKGNAGTDLATLQTQALDAFQTRYAICNVLHGAPAIFSEDLSAAFCRAINDWIAREWLDRDDRLRASIVVPMHSPELAAQEVERVRRRSALRAGADLGDAGTAGRPPHPLAAVSRRGAATTCRSASTPAAATAIRPPTSAGRRTTWRTTSPGPPVSPAC